LLAAKKLAISLMVVNDSGISLGCNSNYANLCDSIDIAMNNISTYSSNVNDKIDEIVEFNFDNYDDE
jgi:hypothetical protein